MVRKEITVCESILVLPRTSILETTAAWADTALCVERVKVAETIANDRKTVKNNALSGYFRSIDTRTGVPH